LSVENGGRTTKPFQEEQADFWGLLSARYQTAHLHDSHRLCKGAKHLFVVGLKDRLVELPLPTHVNSSRISILSALL
jgi:hypothetical protein